MRHKEYVMECEVCKKTYVATRKGSHFCSNVCRAQYDRDKKSKQLKQFETQAQVIQSQAKIIDAILPKPEIEQPSSHLSYSRNYDQIQKILRELNVMRAEAEQAAISAGRGKEHWSPYVKDSVRFQQLCKKIQNMSK
jgi:hypothetical protein